MANMSDYLENSLRDHIFRTSSFAKPTALYIAVCTSTPTDASTGSTLVEPVGNGYARQQLDPDNANWTAASSTNGLTDNASEITFTASGGNWGTITHVAICDAATNGNMLFWGALAVSKEINDGDSLTFAAGSLDITLA